LHIKKPGESTMIRNGIALTLVLGTALAATLATAGGHGGNPAVKARQAHMQLNQHNLGLLFGMVRGNAEYDAGAAAAAAENLVKLSTLDQSTYWPAGTDNASIEGTRALPAIWNDFPGVIAEAQKLSASLSTLQAEAGNGLEAMQAALMPVGQACGSCHEKFRQSNN
jgi:cytochrome c556